MPNGVEGVSPGSWLELGVAGAALFIILVVVLLMFRQQGKSVDKLCGKIDDLVTSFSQNNIMLNETILSNDRDQKEMLRTLSEIHKDLQDMHRRVIRIDTRIYDERMKEEATKNELTQTISD